MRKVQMVWGPSWLFHVFGALSEEVRKYGELLAPICRGAASLVLHIVSLA